MYYSVRAWRFGEFASQDNALGEHLQETSYSMNKTTGFPQNWYHDSVVFMLK
jgi:hypothetical protein